MSTLAQTYVSAIQPLRRNRLYWVFADAATVAKRNLLHVPRIPEELVFSTIQPIMFVLLFRYVFGGAIAVQGTTYVNYLMPGIFVQTIAFGSVTTGIGLADDLQKGLIDRFRSLPMAHSAVLTGRTVADLLRNAFVLLIMLIVGLVVGFRPSASPGGWVLAISLMLLFSFAFSWIAATIGLSVRNVEAAQSAGFIWLFPLTFASSAFVQVSTLPTWLQGFAQNQPVSVVVDAVRAWLLGQPVGDAGWRAFAWCIGILIVFVPFAIWAYERRTAR